MNANLGADAFQKIYQKLSISTPSLHVVLGSGFGAAVDSAPAPRPWIEKGSASFKELPGLHGASAPGHKGVFRFFENSLTKKSLCLQVGRIHGYEGHTPQEVVGPVMSARLAGVPRFILTNAAGGIDPSFGVGDAMLLSDHFNLTGNNPLAGPNPVGKDGKPYGPRFPDLSATYSKKMYEKFRPALAKNGLTVREGVYLGLLGPSYETPSEVAVFGRWGMHAVGMSTVWEAIALKHAGAEVGGLSLISNPACGVGGVVVLDHEDVLKACEKSARKIIDAIFELEN